jgi:hypothetical protein
MNPKVRNRLYGGGLVLMASGFALFPLYMQRAHAGNNLTHQADPLMGHQTMRGAYVNSGSKDVGADPDWERGVYKGKTSGSFAPSPEQVQAVREAMAAKAAAGVKKA